MPIENLHPYPSSRLEAVKLFELYEGDMKTGQGVMFDDFTVAIRWCDARYPHMCTSLWETWPQFREVCVDAFPERELRWIFG